MYLQWNGANSTVPTPVDRSLRLMP